MGFVIATMERYISFIKEWFDNTRPYVSAFTSGSSGSPKKILLSKHDMILSARATNSFFDITNESMLALPLDIGYIAGKMMVVRALEAGCSLKLLPVSNQVAIDEAFDLLAVVPSQIESLLEGGVEKAHKVKNLLIGGAAVSPNVEKTLVSQGWNAYIGYGMTETCSHVALRKIGGDGLYHAMNSVSFDITHDNRLVINLKGRDFPEIETNDIVDLIDSQTFRWLGRADLVINSGGKKLMIRDIEAIYRRLLPNVEFYVGKTSDSKWGERPVFVIKASQDAARSAFDLLCKEVKTLYKPQKFLAVDKWPLGKTGKPLNVF